MRTKPRKDAPVPAGPEPIAVVGLGCRFPGGKSLDAFWQLLRDGGNAITEVPPDRWDAGAHYDPELTQPGKMNTRWGGFIEGIDGFEPGFFGVSAGEASSMDPQHRLLLEVCWEALEDAGLPPRSLTRSAAAVFVGIESFDYALSLKDERTLNAYWASGNAPCFASSRISRVFDLRGPSISLDTGCSSSLYAVHLACQTLRAGDAEVAIAGGVNLLLSPLSTIAASQAWLMAGDGRCKSFDAAADGYVRSDGCGVVVLRRLSEALASGDPIWGVIRGCAANQDGHTGSITKPSAAAQEDVIRRALRQAGVAPQDIDYIEAHGVGTKVADLAEAQALAAVFGSVKARAGRRWIGSVKTNIGHPEAAAGMAALIKVLLGLRHELIPRHLHFRSLNPDVAARGIHLDIATESAPWPRSGKRLRHAGINSFGLGGANVHLVIEEPPSREIEVADEAFLLLPLSARTPTALRALAGRYAAYLEAHPEERFGDLCFTAATGRTHFDHRLAVISRSASAARDALTAVAAGTSAPGVLHASPTKDLTRGEDALRVHLEGLAGRYVGGAPIDLGGLHLAPRPRRPSLPTYPFERRRCWLDDGRTPDRGGETRAPVEEPPALVTLLSGTPLARRREALADFVATEVAGVLGISPELLHRGRGLAELGMKSLMAVELRTRLQRALGPRAALAATIAFDHPTVEALSDHLAQEALGDLVSAEPGAPRPGLSAPVAPVSLDAREPVAIIGMACRFPGEASGLEAFWRLLRNGVDAVTEVPPDRWDASGWYHPDPDVPGKSYSRFGGFLRDVRCFDAGFFRISPREAAGMDPQQRLALEVTWEALENAGLTQERIAGSQTGVFIGSIGSDYHGLRLKHGDPKQLDAYYGTGAIGSAISGRVAHFLGLHGPTMTVDSACSSSLVAVHLACQSLRLGECGVALAGGVNVILAPDGNVLLSRMRALAADGRCKTFDASADGYVRSEGCGVVVLKRLSDAVADGDEVLAVIAGSAVNHDGPSSGFTVPSGASQQALIRRALAEAGVRPPEVGYVEAHGTGTSLGDPIEALALGAVLSEGRPKDEPFLLGSVKTNLGHLEGAAGIAGLIKVVLSLRHQEIPRHLHLRQLNPRIAAERLPLTIPTQTVSWPVNGRRRIAGVSSFGLSGTNAHLIVAEAPSGVPATPAGQRSAVAELLFLSARSEPALRDVARAHRDFLSDGGAGAALALRDVCFTAALRRSQHEHRLAVVGASHQQMVERLEAFLAGEARPGLFSGEVPATGRRRRVVFVCPGQGSQWPSMGRRLMREEPAFREAIARCDEAMRPYVDWSLLDVLTSDAGSSRLEDIDVIQPVLFAIEVALAAQWSAWGVRPDAVIGHSMGEVAAAHLAGALSLDDAARVICRRSKLLRRISGKGAMAVVDLPLEQARFLLAGREDRLSIAVSNSPRSTVLSGDPRAIAEVLAQLEREGVFCRSVKVDVASHSPQVDALRDELLDALADVTPRPVTTPVYSTVVAGAAEEAAFDAPYWVRNLRAPVLFSAAVQRALEDGYDTFVEISPHPTLLPAIEQVMAHLNRTAVVLPSLRRDEDERTHLLGSFGALHAAGYPVELGRVSPAGGRLVSLPPYPFQRERHWFEVEDGGQDARTNSGGLGRRRARVHPVLGERLELASAPGHFIWETDVDVDALPYLRDHLVQGTAVLPGAAYLALALTAADEALGSGARVLADIEFHRGLFLPQGATRTLQSSIATSSDGSALFRVFSRPRRDAAQTPGDGWVLHMSGRIEPTTSAPSLEGAALPAVARLEERCGEEIAVADFYRALERLGNHFGPAHQGIERLKRGQDEALARVRLPRVVEHEAGGYFVHPAFLDACTQVGLAAVPAGEEPRGDAGPLGVKGAIMPVRLDRVVALRRPDAQVWSHARTSAREGTDVAEDLRILDAEGNVLIEILGLQGRYLERSVETALPTALDEWLYEISWQPAPLAERSPQAPAVGPGKWLILGDQRGVGEALAARLSELGEPSVLVFPGRSYASPAPDRFIVCPGEAGDLARVVEQSFGPGASACRGAVYLFSLDAPMTELSAASLRAAQTLVCTSAVQLVQALVAQAGRGTPPRMWFATRGAMRLADDPAPALAQAPLWGIARVIAEEHPGLWGGVVDLCPVAAPAEQALVLSAELRCGDGEDQLAFRGGQRHVARLVRRPRAEVEGRALRLRADGTYLITGGLGGIGLELAEWMVEQGARRLILLGRTPLPPRTEWAGLQADSPFAAQVAAVRSMEALGASVHLAAVDVADEPRLRAFLASFRGEAWPPIRGVVHAAGVVHDRTVATLDEETLFADLGPKVLGGYLLHRLLEDAPLDFFVLFSSAAAILSSPFVGAYAAANAFLDALAHHRRALGQTALSVNWGFWQEVGMAARRERIRGGSLAPQGMGSFSPAQGFEVMRMLIEGDAVQTVVMPVNWKQWGQLHTEGSRSPLLAGLVHERVEQERPAPGGPSLGQALLDVEPGWRRRAKLETHLREQISQVLRLSPSKVGLQQGLGALGLDSLMGLELRRRFEASTGLTLPATLVWTYPTVAALAEHLAERMSIPLEPVAAPPPAREEPPTAGDVPEELSEEEAAALLAETLTMVQRKQ